MISRRSSAGRRRVSGSMSRNTPSYSARPNRHVFPHEKLGRTSRDTDFQTSNDRGSAVTVIKAAAVQLRPVLYSREGTVEKVCRQILALGRQGVQFATFPETVVPYYLTKVRCRAGSARPARASTGGRKSGPRPAVGAHPT